MSFKTLHKNRSLKILIAVTFFLSAAVSIFCQTTVFEGSLGPGDSRLGKYFDTYLFLEKPDGSEEENDDYDELINLSRLELVAEQTGEYLITVSSYEEGESGSYALKVFTWDDASGN